MLVTPRACARGKAFQFCLFVYLSVIKKSHQIWRSRRHSEMQVSLQCRECVMFFSLLYRHLKRAMSAINCVFLCGISTISRKVKGTHDLPPPWPLELGDLSPPTYPLLPSVAVVSWVSPPQWRAGWYDCSGRWDCYGRWGREEVWHPTESPILAFPVLPVKQYNTHTKIKKSTISCIHCYCLLNMKHWSLSSCMYTHT